MDRIGLESLSAGETTRHEYCTETGELLLARGVLLSERHLDVLRRRNISTLYIKKSEEESDLHEILSPDFNKVFDDLPLLEEADMPPTAPLQVYTFPKNTPQAMQLPEFREIKAGEAGLTQLIQSKQTFNLDNRLQEGRCVDRPVGIALKDKLRQITTRERTDEYRRMVQAVYNSAILRTKTILDTLADGKRIDYCSARGVVEQIMKVFLNDMGYLLNLVAMERKGEEYIYHHSLNVSIYSLCLATAFGYNQHQVLEIGIGGLLHDIGMLLVPNGIYLKKGKLDKEEWYEIMKHPILGLHLLEKVDRLPEWIPYMAYQCHERENGKGYPKQRSGRLIHNYAKICAISDMYEAFSSPRPYREAFIPYKALELVIKASRQGLVSGELVRSFVQYMSLFPIGSIVELSNKCIGKVVRALPTSPSKPVVCILFDAEGKRLPFERIYEDDLSTNLSVSVVRTHPNRFRDIDWMEGF